MKITSSIRGVWFLKLSKIERSGGKVSKKAPLGRVASPADKLEEKCKEY